MALAIIVIGLFVLYREARRHEKVISAQRVSQEVKRRFLREQKASKVTKLVVISLLVFHIRATLIYQLNKPPTFLRLLPLFFYSIGGFILILNSSVNPFIYATIKRQFRVAFFKIIMNKTQRQVQQIESRVFGSANTVGVLHQIEEQGRNQRDLSNTLQSDPDQLIH